MKKQLTVLLLNFLFITYYSQSTVSNNNFQNKNIFPNPVTAESYSISKVGKLPMDLFRGKANINIPIHTINIDGVTIPISLSYNTGGIKLNEVAGTVGLGWSLNIPGTINHSVIGKDDTKINFFNKNINTYASYNGYVSHLSYDDQRRDNLWKLYDGNYDTKPDMYHYNLPGISGSFLLSSNNLGLTVPNENIKIEYTPDPAIYQRKFRITDISGNLFWFSPKNLSSSEDPTNPVSDNITSSLFRLDSLRTTNNKTVKFFYEKQLNYTEKNTIERIYTKIGVDYDPGNFYFNLLPSYEKWNTNTGNTENLISRIEFPEGRVEFKYSNDESGSLPIENGQQYRKDLNTNTAFALKKIVVKDKFNRMISDYRLNYSYFSSDNPIKTYEDYRLKLLNVYDALAQTYYKFYYDENYQMPARNSNNDDYWGYFNGLANSSSMSNLPQRIFTDNTDFNPDLLPSIQRRDRAPNSNYTQIGVLKSIEYPTKGRKNIYYENPFTEQFNTSTYFISDGIGDGILSVGNPADIWTYTDNQTKTFILNTNDIPGNGFSPAFTYSFGSGCLTAETDGPQSEHPDPENGDATECFGNIRFSSLNHPDQVRNFTSNGHLFEGALPISNSNLEFPIKVELSVNRMGYCNCGVNAGLSWQKELVITSTTPNYLGGLRISRIEDVDQNNISNIFEYKYGKFNSVANKFENISILKQPFNFTRIDKKIFRKFDDQGVELFPSRIQEFFTLSNSNQSPNSYGSSDIVTYPYVTEENGLGKILYEFSDKDSSLQSILPTEVENYGDWKYGIPLSEKYINKNGDTIRTVHYKYQFNPIKNALSEFNTNDVSKIAFASDFLIIPSKIQVTSGYEGEIFQVENKINFIESAKIENTEIIEKNFLAGKIVEKKINNGYSDTDIVKPINLKNSSTLFSTGDIQETTYAYAHEKNNQLLIAKNMTGIPLETTTTQTKDGVTKTLGRSETLYPTALPTAQAGTLVLPLSSVSYDVLTNAPSTEVSYDKYDDKGNLLQYTGKDGIPVAIVWGYNKTQPIARVEGMAYDQLVSAVSVSGIVTASDNDAADPTKEGLLLDALNSFRKE